MDDVSTMQAIVTPQGSISSESTVERLALFYADGTPVDFSSDTVVGPQGAIGTQGSQGASGAQGSQGHTGAGTQGSQGASGTQGSQGSTGAGTQGSQGSTGAGVQGSQGSSGATGPSNVGAPVVVGTAIGTAAKTVTDAAPANNTFVSVKFTNGNSAETPTVAFAGGGAIPILLGGTAVTAAKMTVAANGVVVFFFDGTNLHQLGTVA